MKGAYKTLKRSDVQVIPFTANKLWSVNTASYTDLGINIFVGRNLTGSFYDNETLTTDSASSETQYQKLVYENIKHLYYSNYLTGSLPTMTSSFDNFDQTNINIGVDSILSSSYSPLFNGPVKFFPTESNAIIRVMSIPQNIFGSKVLPGTFNMYGDEYNIIDDEEGNLFDDSYGGLINVGNIVYPHGVIIITNPSYSTFLPTASSDSFTPSVADQISGFFTLTFKGEHTIYENIIKCGVSEDEFNYTLNPSAISGSDSQVADFATGSYFNPYVTTVGLYNEANELLAIGKIAKPIFIPRTSDITFIVSYDS